MPSYNQQVGIPSCSVDKALVISIEDYFRNDVLEILNIPVVESEKPEVDISSTTIHDSFGKDTYVTIKEYKQALFRNDTKGITIHFNLVSRERDLNITLRFGKAIDNCDLEISLSGENAREKVRAIEEGLITILEHNENLNWILYPRDLVTTIAGLGLFICGLLAFKADWTTASRFICGLICAIGIFFFTGCRYFKGYCTFATNKQKQLDKWFTWLVGGILGFLLFSTLFASIRKSVFGF